MQLDNIFLKAYKETFRSKAEFYKDEIELILSCLQDIGESYLLLLMDLKDFFTPETTLQKKHEILFNFAPYLIREYSFFPTRIYHYLKQNIVKIDFKNNFDPLGELYQKVISLSKKQEQGIVFTPREIIKYILDELKYSFSLKNRKESSIIDLACGSGLFLIEATIRIMKFYSEKNLSMVSAVKFIENNVFGFDIDLIAVYLSKLNLLITFVKYSKGQFPTEITFTPKIFRVNSLEKSISMRFIEKKKFSFVVGNPPYIDSKRLSSKIKEICKKNFPRVATMHYDIYSCFMALGTEIMNNNGKLGFIIPNKFLISRYAKVLREKFLSENLIAQIVDLAHENVFSPAVYPILLFLDKSKEHSNIEMLPNLKLKDLKNNNIKQKYNVESKTFAHTKNKTIFFPLRSTNTLLNRIFEDADSSLGELIRFRWAISFHRKGLREKFVFKKKRSENSHKFIGGQPFGGNREIERYKLNWWGFWIDYDTSKAKELNNSFQDIKFFKDKKIILCQHSLRIRATIDEEGYVCKDIFLLGHLTEKSISEKISLELILAILNSELYSFIYNTMYSGTEIMGKYLHYLPMFLHDLPFIKPSSSLADTIEKNVRNLLEKEKTFNPNLDREIDEFVYSLYNCTEEEKLKIKQHMKEVLIK